jgi:hypothetical protein
LATWEVRVQPFRAYYDVDEDRQTVWVRRIGDGDRAVVGRSAPIDGLTSALTFIDSGTTIPVRDDDDLEAETVAANPEFVRPVAESCRIHARDPHQGTSIEEVYELFALITHGVDAIGPAGEAGDVMVRVPAGLHRASVDRADREHTTVHASVVSLIVRDIASVNPKAA